VPLWQPASVVFFECLCYVVCVLRLINIVVVVVVDFSSRRVLRCRKQEIGL